MKRLLSYFADGATSKPAGLVGMEVETSFTNEADGPATLEQSQKLFRNLVATERWSVFQTKGDFIAELKGREGDMIRYELGRQNIEISTSPQVPGKIVCRTRLLLEELYQAARPIRLQPYFGPILRAEGDLLAVPDERDAIWIKLDGRQALNALANTSSVHFVLDTTVAQAVQTINRLNERRDDFLAEFPQDANWRYYLANSLTDYEPTRYGGPVSVDSLAEYCALLAKHRVVTASGLRPFVETEVNINLFLRSIWWHFRLRRYGETLCLEVRPNGRFRDEYFSSQLERVLSRAW